MGEAEGVEGGWGVRRWLWQGREGRREGGGFEEFGDGEGDGGEGVVFGCLRAGLQEACRSMTKARFTTPRNHLVRRLRRSMIPEGSTL